MKVQKKEENVFSTSALDLFCSAMGVFMLLCFVVMPYYRNEESVKDVDASVVTPGLTVSVSWSLKDVVLKPNATMALQEFYDKYNYRSVDLDLVVSELLPKHDKAICHDFNHIGKYEESKARLVADGQIGGSEAWVQPAVVPGEVCEAYAANFEDTLLMIQPCNIPQSYTLVLRVLVLTGNGETQEWELELPDAERRQYLLTKPEQDKVRDVGYTATEFPRKKLISLLRFTVGADSSITAEPMEGSKLKQISK